ncbi:stalk domain-containing protein [Paenibacillus eucommiae]|uniref:Copper amine oxidase-like N-terminal domain-containing protein n=1 Tax=Paenibacillus eucommiae TaxID=1355755 RepID=A0ABS4IX07_9BACL|nr:stalk domain-containing protein [Paenibacillus eucommiae]MBP1991615.1 hypothetical protein [Paenibacillus eucommiae]
MNKFFQRFIIMTMSLTLMFASSFPVFADEPAPATGINMDIGILINGSMLVPLRDITDALHAELIWDGKQKSITLNKEGSSVFMKIGDPAVTVNGQSTMLEVAPRIEDDRTFVPLRLISEAFGAKVEWDGKKQMATVKSDDLTLYVMGYPYFEWKGHHFVYSGELKNGLPHGKGRAVEGTTIYDKVWYEGPWDQGRPVQMTKDNYKIYVNGDYLKSEYPPIVRNNVVYVPLWALLGKVKLSAEQVDGFLKINHPKQVILVGSNSNLSATVSQNQDWHYNRMEYPIISENYVMYAPVSFLIKELDIKAAWGSDRRIDLTAGDLSKDIDWSTNIQVQVQITKLTTDIAAENIWKKYAKSLWSSRDLPYPGNERFYQYEKLTLIDYNGLNATLSNGSTTIKFTFYSLDSLTSSFYTKDLLADFNWSKDIKDSIRREKVRIGMTKEQVYYSWGEPDNLNAYDSMEQWVYRYGTSFDAQYLYFTNGVLDTIQK